VKKIYKYRIYPTKAHIAKMESALAACCGLYNACLEERITLHKEKGVSVSGYDQIGRAYAYGVNGLRDVYAQVVQDTVLRLDKAFKAFFRRVKNGGKPGFPRFRSVKRYDSFCYPQSGFKLNDEKHLKLSKIGIVKIKLHRPIQGTVKQCTVKRDGCGHWYVCFSVDTNRKPRKSRNKKVIGMDLGCESFATLSDGTVVKHPHYYKETGKEIGVVQAKYSRTKNLRHKAKLNRLHTKLVNQHNDFLHKESRKLVNKYGAVCVEKLDVAGMVDGGHRSLNRSIMDSCWGKFVFMLVYKAEEAGKRVIEVNPAYTSQRCSRCGTVAEKSLGDRTHRCGCGLVTGRDVNAALNILASGTEALRLERKKAVGLSPR